MAVWLFQATPQKFNLSRALRKAKVGDEGQWTVTQFKGSVRSGDTILLWQAGKRAGLHAVGVLTSEPVEKPFFATSARDLPKGALWVKFRYVRILTEPLLRVPLSKHLVVKDMALVSEHGPFRGTNFRVTKEQWKVLQKYLPTPPRTLLENVAREATRAEKGGEFDPKNLIDARKRIARSIALRQGQPTFRRKLLEAYGGKCLISGCDAEAALEAAHIMPYRGAHTNALENGLLLRADLHTLFDCGLLAIDEKMRVVLAPELRNTSYKAFHRKPLRFATGTTQRPNKEALSIHRQTSGLF